MTHHSVDASVVMAMYNEEAHLGEALAALSAQVTHRTWEVIIADNGSTDASVEIAERYAGSFASFRLVSAHEHRGPAHARNVAISIARGRLLLFCDCDDVTTRGWLEAMADGLERDSFAGGHLDMYALNSKTTRCWRPVSAEPGLPAVQGRRFAVGGNFGCTRAVFDAVGGFDGTLSHAEDVDFALRARQVGVEPVYIANAVIHYRLRVGVRAAVRQAHHSGRVVASLYRRHDLATPTIGDQSRVALRLLKQCLREIGHGRVPRAAIWRAAFLLGELAGTIRDPGFWRGEPTYTHKTRWRDVQRSRARRLEGMWRKARGRERE